MLVERVKLEVVVLPEEAGTSPSSGTYDKGEAVDLKFESAYGWRFVQWQGPEIAEVKQPGNNHHPKRADTTGSCAFVKKPRNLYLMVDDEG